MLKRSPIRRTPRKAIPKAVKRYWDSLPDACPVCAAPGTVIHHVMADAPAKTSRRDDYVVSRLCPFHHNMGSSSVHLLGSEKAFHLLHGVNLVAIAVRNRDEWLAKQ